MKESPPHLEPLPLHTEALARPGPLRSLLRGPRNLSAWGDSGLFVRWFSAEISKVRSQGQLAMEAGQRAVNRNINGATFTCSRSCHPEALPCTLYASNLWNVNTGQDDSWAGPKAKWCPKRTVCKESKKAVIMATGMMTTGLKVKNSV